MPQEQPNKEEIASHYNFANFYICGIVHRMVEKLAQALRMVSRCHSYLVWLIQALVFVEICLYFSIHTLIISVILMHGYNLSSWLCDSNTKEWVPKGAGEDHATSIYFIVQVLTVESMIGMGNSTLWQGFIYDSAFGLRPVFSGLNQQQVQSTSKLKDCTCGLRFHPTWDKAASIFAWQRRLAIFWSQHCFGPKDIQNRPSKLKTLLLPP